MFILRDGEDIKGCFSNKELILLTLRTEYDCDKEIAITTQNEYIQQYKNEIKELESQIKELSESNLHNIPLRRRINNLDYQIIASEAVIKKFSRDSKDFSLNDLLDFYNYDLEEHELITYNGAGHGLEKDEVAIQRASEAFEEYVHLYLQ